MKLRISSSVTTPFPPILAILLFTNLIGCASTTRIVEVAHPSAEPNLVHDRAEVFLNDDHKVRGTIHAIRSNELVIRDDISEKLIVLPNEKIMGQRLLVLESCQLMLEQPLRRWLLVPSFAVPGLGQLLYEDSLTVSGGTHMTIHLASMGGLVNAMNLGSNRGPAVGVAAGILAANWLWSLTEAIILGSEQSTEEPSWNCSPLQED